VSERNPYDVLGVKPGATQKQLRSAWIKRTRVLHPDRFDKEKQPVDWQMANDMLQELNDAYNSVKADIEQPFSNSTTYSDAPRHEADKHAPPPQASPGVAPSKKIIPTKGDVGLTLAVMSILCGFTSVPAIIMAHIARSEGERNRKTKWALIIGYAVVSFWIIDLTVEHSSDDREATNSSIQDAPTSTTEEAAVNNTEQPLHSQEIKRQAERAAQEEKLFVGDLSRAREALSSSKLSDAELLLTDAGQLKPDDKQLNALQAQLKKAQLKDAQVEKAQLEKAQFKAITTSFQGSIQDGDLTNAFAEFNTAHELLPNDPSLASLQSQLDNLKNRVFQSIDTKLAALDIDGANKDYSDLAASFATESRLPEYKAKIAKVAFDLAIKAFHQAIQSQDIDTASATLDKAHSLIPDNASLETLTKELVETKYAKYASDFSIYLSNDRFKEAKTELKRLQDLKIEPDRTAGLSNELSSLIKTTIASDIDRGNDALRSNNVDQASQALADAAALDSTNSEVMAFEALFVTREQLNKVVEAAQKVHDSNPDNDNATLFLAAEKDKLDKQNQATATTLLVQAKDAAAKLDWSKAGELSNESIQAFPLPDAQAMADKSSFMLLPILDAHSIYLECKKLQELRSQNHLTGSIDPQTSLSIRIGQRVRFSACLITKSSPYDAGFPKTYTFEEHFQTNHPVGAYFGLSINTCFSAGPTPPDSIRTSLVRGAFENIQGTISAIAVDPTWPLTNPETALLNIEMSDCQLVP